ncbi:MAG: SRPBCC family protein [Actinomycetota bacterium]
MTEATVTVETAPDRVERRSVVVAATAAEIFDLLADPSRHHEIDGSGMVQGSKTSAPGRLSEGTRFGMRMKLGVPYPITNTVVEFEENERIAWRHLGRHVWRYTLEPIDDGARTKVTEEFDWRPALFPPAIEWAGYPARNGAAIEGTLRRLAEVMSPG